MPGARRTRGLVCKCVQKGAHEHTGQRRRPIFPAQWVYGLYRAFPGRAGLVVTVAGGIASQLDASVGASGRQDHTTSPHAYVTGNPWRILVGKNRSAVPNPKMYLVFDIGGKK